MSGNPYSHGRRRKVCTALVMTVLVSVVSSAALGAGSQLVRGDEVRVVAGDSAFTGWVRSAGHDRMILSVSGLVRPVSLRYDSISRIQVNGGRAVGRGFLMGGGIGLLCGAGVGALIAFQSEDDTGGFDPIKPGDAALMGGIVGGIVGFLVGGAIGAESAHVQWRDVDPHTLGLLLPDSGGGVSLVLSRSF